MPRDDRLAHLGPAQQVVDDLVARDRRRAVARERLQRLALARSDAAGDRDGDRAASLRRRDAASGSSAAARAASASGSAAASALVGGSVAASSASASADGGLRRSVLGRRQLVLGRLLGLASRRPAPRRRPPRRGRSSGARVHRLAAVGARLHRIGVLDALQREREPAALAVDLDDLHVDRLALRDDLARVLDVVLRELGDVHEALRRPGGSRRTRRT